MNRKKRPSISKPSKRIRENSLGNTETSLPKDGREGTFWIEFSSTDAQLVIAAREGDKHAFVEIVARHQGLVTGVTLGVLGYFAASEDG